MVHTTMPTSPAGAMLEMMQSARTECKGSYQEGRGISLDSLVPPKPEPQGYGVYLESLLKAPLAALAEEPEQEEDARSEKSGSTASEKSTAASSTEPASVYGAARVALSALHGPAITQAILGLQVHAHKDLEGLAAAIFESAVADPARTLLAADLIKALLPFMVTCYNGKKSVTLLDEVKLRCDASVATITSPEPDAACFGSVLLLGHLFVRGLLGLATVKDLFAKLVFTETAPADHAVNLATHVLLTCAPALPWSPTGAQMADYVVLRLQELKGHACYSDTTKAAIVAVVEHERARKLSLQAPKRSARRGDRSAARRADRAGSRRQAAEAPASRVVRS